ncbi:MAG: chemoreceptor glutamine deamidase CheD [Burkholderiales bacterium]|nr:MAG: chemoreceptor glutamine deamidase CheD [Burkholderiales bacterium]
MHPMNPTTAASLRQTAPGLFPKSSDKIRALRERPAREYEAHTFYYDASFKTDAVKILPGEYYVHDGDDLLLMTVLGSCVAACLVDRSARLGGMNHFMLPDGGTAGRYGAYAMELLINEMMKRGARRERLEAKVFGGGQVMRNFSTMNVGEQNVKFIEQFLAAERIQIVSRDVLDIHPRKVCLFPGSARALCKKLATTQVDAIATEESAFRGRLSKQPAAASAGSVELF